MFAKLWEEGGEYLGYDFIKMVKNDNIGITEGKWDQKIPKLYNVIYEQPFWLSP